MELAQPVNQRVMIWATAVNRFQELHHPLSKYPNSRWIYIDVYYGSGWQADRLGNELNKMGWGSRDPNGQIFVRHSSWSHWSNDEHHGGAKPNKGLNPRCHPLLSTTRSRTPPTVLGCPPDVEFEGWTGHSRSRRVLPQYSGQTTCLASSRTRASCATTPRDRV